MEDVRFEAAVARLKHELELVPTKRALYKMIGAQEKVTARFGALFSPRALDTLGAEDFRRFLYLEHNCHWSQLYRRGNGAADDIGRLRKGLKILLDKSRGIPERWNATQVPGLGKAIKSALLLVVYPDRYGVWNGVSERQIKEFGLFPRVYPVTDKGKAYEALNELLNRLAHAVGTDLWTLDGLFWGMDPDRSSRVEQQLASLL